MDYYQLYPLQINPDTHEPFLRLRPPYAHLILTPPRLSDCPCIISAVKSRCLRHNTPALHRPASEAFRAEHADALIASDSRRCEDVLFELEAAEAEYGKLKVVSGCPVQSLRMLQDGGREILVGGVTVTRSTFPEVLDDNERAILCGENEAKDPGDPRILWTMSCWLLPEYQKQDIGSTALSTLIWDWAVPRMAARKIVAHVPLGDQAGRKVFEKNGFTFTRWIDDMRTRPGERRGMYVLEWNMGQRFDRASSRSRDIAPMVPAKFNVKLDVAAAFISY